MEGERESLRAGWSGELHMRKSLWGENNRSALQDPTASQRVFNVGQGTLHSACIHCGQQYLGYECGPCRRPWP